MDKIYQCRYYGTHTETGELSPKNYPVDLTADILKTDLIPLFNSEGITRLEIQGDPGAAFWIGIDGKTPLGPLFLGITGIYSLDLQTDQKLTHFHIGPTEEDFTKSPRLRNLNIVNAVDSVDEGYTMDVENNTHRNAYIIVTVTY